MASGMFVRMSKMHRIIELCEEPRRFSDLARLLKITDAGLTKNLKSLQKLGWLKKAEDGKYELTQSGRNMLPNARRASSVLENFKTAPQIHDNLMVNYFGLEEKNGKSLLSQINKILKEYLERHSDKDFTIMVLYKSKAPVNKLDSRSLRW
jgi:DNA-binding HxlR family transcriptional regulator